MYSLLVAVLLVWPTQLTLVTEIVQSSHLARARLVAESGTTSLGTVLSSTTDVTQASLKTTQARQGTSQLAPPLVQLPTTFQLNIPLSPATTEMTDIGASPTPNPSLTPPSLPLVTAAPSPSLQPTSLPIVTVPPPSFEPSPVPLPLPPAVTPSPTPNSVILPSPSTTPLPSPEVVSPSPSPSPTPHPGNGQGPAETPPPKDKEKGKGKSTGSNGVVLGMQTKRSFFTFPLYSFWIYVHGLLLHMR